MSEVHILAKHAVLAKHVWRSMTTARVVTTIYGCISLRSRSIVVTTLAVVMAWWRSLWGGAVICNTRRLLRLEQIVHIADLLLKPGVQIVALDLFACQLEKVLALFIGQRERFGALHWAA